METKNWEGREGHCKFSKIYRKSVQCSRSGEDVDSSAVLLCCVGMAQVCCAAPSLGCWRNFSSSVHIRWRRPFKRRSSRRAEGNNYTANLRSGFTMDCCYLANGVKKERDDNKAKGDDAGRSRGTEEVVKRRTQLLHITLTASSHWTVDVSSNESKLREKLTICRNINKSTRFLRRTPERKCPGVGSN